MTEERTPRGTADLFESGAQGAGSGHADAESEERMYDAEVEERQLPREEDSVPLIEERDAESYRSRWQQTQASFVDEPQQAVRDADQLVAELIQQLAKQFADARSRLEEQWAAGGDVTTEELRRALQQYRSFFNRLLRV